MSESIAQSSSQSGDERTGSVYVFISILVWISAIGQGKQMRWSGGICLIVKTESLRTSSGNIRIESSGSSLPRYVPAPLEMVYLKRWVKETLGFLTIKALIRDAKVASAQLRKPGNSMNVSLLQPSTRTVEDWFHKVARGFLVQMIARTASEHEEDTECWSLLKLKRKKANHQLKLILWIWMSFQESPPFRITGIRVRILQTERLLIITTPGFRGCSKIELIAMQKKPEVVVCEPRSSIGGNLPEELEKNSFPSIAAMALMGKAMKAFQPCEFPEEGFLLFWNTNVFLKNTSYVVNSLLVAVLPHAGPVERCPSLNKPLTLGPFSACIIQGNQGHLLASHCTRPIDFTVMSEVNGFIRDPSASPPQQAASHRFLQMRISFATTAARPQFEARNATTEYPEEILERSQQPTQRPADLLSFRPVKQICEAVQRRKSARVVVELWCDRRSIIGSFPPPLSSRRAIKSAEPEAILRCFWVAHGEGASLIGEAFGSAHQEAFYKIYKI
nr:F-box family protein, putative isoform 1 [Ipomoea batatas]